jgi:hypothetical protein
VKHILKLQTIQDPQERANFVRKFKIELHREMMPPSTAPTVTEALVGELKHFMARTRYITAGVVLITGLQSAIGL